MKKIVKMMALCLCLLAMISLAGCFGESGTPTVTVSEPVEYEPTVVDVTPEPTDTPEPEVENGASDEPSTTNLPVVMPEGVTVDVAHEEPMFNDEDVLQEIVIADNECINIAVNSLEDNDAAKYTFNVHAENLSDDNVVLTLQSISVNSFSVQPNWSCTVAGDSNLNATVGIVKNIITEYAINHISNVGFTFSISQEDGTEFCDPITCEYRIEDIVLE